jgi:hypothetical protein
MNVLASAFLKVDKKIEILFHEIYKSIIKHIKLSNNLSINF